jgi:hypothetical protein
MAHIFSCAAGLLVASVSASAQSSQSPEKTMFKRNFAVCGNFRPCSERRNTAEPTRRCHIL